MCALSIIFLYYLFHFASQANYVSTEIDRCERTCIYCKRNFYFMYVYN